MRELGIFFCGSYLYGGMHGRMNYVSNGFTFWPKGKGVRSHPTYSKNFLSA